LKTVVESIEENKKVVIKEDRMPTIQSVEEDKDSVLMEESMRPDTKIIPPLNKNKESNITNNSKEGKVSEDKSFNEVEEQSNKEEEKFLENSREILTPKVRASKKFNNEFPISQMECYNIIKLALIEARTGMTQLIEPKVILGRGEDGKEYPVIMIVDLMNILLPLCNDKLESEQQLLDFLKSFVINDENYILAQILLEGFGELETEDGDLIVEMENLDEESLTIMTKLVRYMQETNSNLLDLFKEYMYQQDIAVEDDTMVLDLIESKDFYSVLKTIQVAQNECSNLSEFLCIDKEYPNVFYMKRILKLLEYVAIK
jgi:hypothetical protein